MNSVMEFTRLNINQIYEMLSTDFLAYANYCVMKRKEQNEKTRQRIAEMKKGKGK